jgi:hypothetical protein
MSVIFNKIIQINKTEDDIRSKPESITNDMVHIIKMKNLEYTPGDFSEKIVLTGFFLEKNRFNHVDRAGSKKKETISDNSFNMEFSKKTFDLLTYLNWDNIVVAGGSLVNIITKSNEKLNDVDIFVYDLDRDQAKLKIDHVISSIKQKATDMNYDTRVYMNSNVINIYVFDNKKLLQIQIILRLYDTLAHVLIGFDVDCCCVAYNGKNILVTDRGLHALKYRVNTANLKRRSPSYENRLIKYSFRGFDVMTDFKYEQIYNKMFFMAPENHGFTRLLEQELINNGQLKNIIFNNTLRFRQTASYTENHSFYVKENLEIKNIRNTESCITKHNANIENETLKFREYNIKNIEFMEINVMEQFTGSFHPITDEKWANPASIDDINIRESSDPLGRPNEFIKLKYNGYHNISEFEGETTNMKDISKFDAKCLAVMYVANESDVIRIVENKYIPKTNNMYKITPVQLAILLGRTKLAISLMKGHNYETMKDLIYMMDNDKLFTNYCNSSGKSCTDVDKSLVTKFECENISDNIHNQNKGSNNLDEFYSLNEFDMAVKIGTDSNISAYRNVDITLLPFNVIKILYEKNITPSLWNFIIKKFKQDDIFKLRELMKDENELSVLNYIIHSFESTENKRCVKTNDNIKKLLTLKNMWNDEHTFASLHNEFNKINHNLYTCMLNIRNPNLTLSVIDTLIGKSTSSSNSYAHCGVDGGKLFDTLVDYVLFLDDVNLIQKIITKDDIYIKLKYQYKIESFNGKIREFFNKIDSDRQNEKIKTNKILKNTEAHINAINDGELQENYQRYENVFGMTPDDNIIAKLLLLYNKVFNKKEQMNEKDLTTLKNMRKAVHNIRRNNEYNVVDKKYFYSLDLHNLFFSKYGDFDTNESMEKIIKTCTEVSNEDIEYIDVNDDLLSDIDINESVEKSIKTHKKVPQTETSAVIAESNIENSDFDNDNDDDDNDNDDNDSSSDNENNENTDTDDESSNNTNESV